MEYIVLTKPETTLIRQAAQLHIQSLSYRSFITIFGNSFLYEIFKTLLLRKLGVMVIAKENHELQGFVLGCFDSSKLIKVIFYRIHILLPIIIWKIICNPFIFKKIMETLFYNSKEDSNIEAELVVIVVNPNLRSQNIGGKLIGILDEEFKNAGIFHYKVTVHNEMIRSNNFYVKNNFIYSKSFDMYNVKWNLYFKHIMQ